MKVLKIGASWCPGCIIMKPIWKEIEEENKWLETEFYDYDEDIEKIIKWNVGKDLPIFIFIDKNNNEILRLIGEHSKEELIDVIEKNKDK